MNKVILVGRIGTDIEVRFGQSGTAFCNFRMVTTEFYKGERHDEWHNVTCFGKTAEFVGKHFSKGKPVCVDGKLQTEQWEDKQGSKRYTTKVMARGVEFVPQNKGADYAGDGGGGDDSGPVDDVDMPF